MIANHLTFFKLFLKNPLRIGSLIPSSSSLGIRIYKALADLDKSKVVELGAGTGAISKYIATYNPILVEIEHSLLKHLNVLQPQCQVINKCAIDYLNQTEAPSGYVISIPLINNPEGPQLIKALNRLQERDLINWCILYTYGYKNPLKSIKFNRAERIDIVLNNLPPANIWLYE